MYINTKKTFYYNFMTTKAEEEAAVARNATQQVTRTLVEVWEQVGTRGVEQNNPWQIRKLISSSEVGSGKLVIQMEDMLEHVFRYWRVELANEVLGGKKCPVVVVNYTCSDEQGSNCIPKMVQGDNVYLMAGPNDTFFLTMPQFLHIRSTHLASGDEIGLFWDPRNAHFCFKVLRRSSSTSTVP